jgi:hypothetical protein
VAHPAFDNDERCRGPQPEEGATIVSIFRISGSAPATPPQRQAAEPADDRNPDAFPKVAVGAR